VRRLHILRALPAGASGWLAGAAALVVLLGVLPVLLWPEQFANLSRRFFFSWQVPAAVIPFTLEISPGDTVAAKGRPITLSVRVRPQVGNVALPLACTLIQVNADGQTKRWPMRADRADAFSVHLDQVAGDFRYHVEAGTVASPEFQVTAIEPVEVAADGPTITVTPPEYARAAVATEAIQGFADLSALQYSQVTLAFRFTRPAVAASLHWTAAADTKTKDQPKDKMVPLDLTSEGQEAQCQMPATAAGTCRVVLEAGHGIRTTADVCRLTVKPDRPPAFVKVSGRDDALTVQPYERIPLEIDLAD